LILTDKSTSSLSIFTDFDIALSNSSCEKPSRKKRFVNTSDPNSIREWAAHLSVHPTLPGGELENLVPDKERLKSILAYEDIKGGKDKSEEKDEPGEKKDEEEEKKSSPPSKKDEDEQLPEMVIWHWKDKRLQSMQQVQESRDKNFNYLAIYHVKDKKFIRLADENVKDVSCAPEHKFAIGRDNQNYELIGNLEGRRYQDIYVVIEHLRGQVADISFIMLAAAKKIAQGTSGQVVGILLGYNAQKLANNLAADRVDYIDHPTLAEFSSEAYLTALTEILRKAEPRAVLFGNTSIGSDIASVLSVKLDLPMVSSCISFNPDGKFTSQICGGKIMTEGTLPSES